MQLPIEAKILQHFYERTNQTRKNIFTAPKALQVSIGEATTLPTSCGHSRFSSNSSIKNGIGARGVTCFAYVRHIAPAAWRPAHLMLGIGGKGKSLFRKRRHFPKSNGLL